MLRCWSEYILPHSTPGLSLGYSINITIQKGKGKSGIIEDFEVEGNKDEFNKKTEEASPMGDRVSEGCEKCERRTRGN